MIKGYFYFFERYVPLQALAFQLIIGCLEFLIGCIGSAETKILIAIIIPSPYS
jgi:hypothetical protein